MIAARKLRDDPAITGVGIDLAVQAMGQQAISA
jgi:hypothetical protein